MKKLFLLMVGLLIGFAFQQTVSGSPPTRDIVITASMGQQQLATLDVVYITREQTFPVTIYSTQVNYQVRIVTMETVVQSDLPQPPCLISNKGSNSTAHLIILTRLCPILLMENANSKTLIKTSPPNADAYNLV